MDLTFESPWSEIFYNITALRLCGRCVQAPEVPGSAQAAAFFNRSGIFIPGMEFSTGPVFSSRKSLHGQGLRLKAPAGNHPQSTLRTAPVFAEVTSFA